MKIILVLNIALVIISIMFFLNLYTPMPWIAGKAVFENDNSHFICIFNNKGASSEIPVALCCPEIEKQLSCKEKGENYICSVSDNSERFYTASKKTLSYCLEAGFNVNIGE